MTCRYTEDCRMFAYIRESRIREDLLLRYCEGDERESCERLKLKSAGKPVPLDLLPDGSTIDD